MVAQHGCGADQHGKGDSGDNQYPLHAGDNYHKNPSGIAKILLADRRSTFLAVRADAFST
jgi:hypothetical protein